ncbi:hypothetical protein QBC45DRAFT_437405 [Copromyces sp. CBS 386.78]|nr:hypothetical protein QBC45DRAFT_437405 [Copromyces sp. CBS 386.78]
MSSAPQSSQSHGGKAARITTPESIPTLQIESEGIVRCHVTFKTDGAGNFRAKGNVQPFNTTMNSFMHRLQTHVVLFILRKLEKTSFIRATEPSHKDLCAASDGLYRLEESFLDLDVSIIKETKVEEVMRGILNLENIVEDEEIEFQWKARSQALLNE